MKPTRPVMRYFGGKWSLAPWIISHFPPHRIYVEPFGGVASVLMRKPRSYAEVYNDLNGDLVNVFRVLRDPATAELLERALALTPYSRAEFKLSLLNEEFDSVERARRTITLTAMAFGSSGTDKGRASFRAVSHFSNASHARVWARYSEQVAAYCSRLSGVTIEQKPAVDVIRQQDRIDTLFYVDPPYPAETRGSKSMYAHEMTEMQHRELADVLHGVAGMVVLSSYNSVFYDDLFGDWLRVDRAAHADGGRDRTESLWLNASAAGAVALDTPVQLAL